jgi:hypothetical protein
VDSLSCGYTHVTFGYDTNLAQLDSVAFGYNPNSHFPSLTFRSDPVTFGYNLNLFHSKLIAFGYGQHSVHSYWVTFGYDQSLNCSDVTAFGYNCNPLRSDSVAFGYHNYVRSVFLKHSESTQIANAVDFHYYYSLKACPSPTE